MKINKDAVAKKSEDVALGLMLKEAAGSEATELARVIRLIAATSHDSLVLIAILYVFENR